MIIYEPVKQVLSAGLEVDKIIDRLLSNGTAVPIVPGTASSTNLIGDYSVTPINLDYTPSSGIHCIHELIVCFKDTGTMDTDAYANNVTLTNGITLLLRRSAATVLDITANDPIKTNQQLFCYSSNSNNFAFGTGDEFLQVYINFTEMYGGPLRLVAATSDTLRVRLADNFSGINVHMFRVRGYIE